MNVDTDNRELFDNIWVWEKIQSLDLPDLRKFINQIDKKIPLDEFKQLLKDKIKDMPEYKINKPIIKFIINYFKI